MKGGDIGRLPRAYNSCLIIMLTEVGIQRQKGGQLNGKENRHINDSHYAGDPYDGLNGLGRM